MRYFPGAPSLAPAPEPSRRHRFAVLAALVLASGALAMPLANAEDDEDKLKHDQHQVEQQIDRAQDHLEESSHRAARATQRLQQAQAQLSSARDRLQRVRERLRDARVLRDRLARQLERAEDRLELAAAELREAREEVARQRDELRSTVLGMATQGDPDLAMFSSLISSGSIEDMLVNETAGDMVVGRQDQVLDGLEAAEEALAEHKAEVRDARDQVAEQKAAAKANLQQIRTLYGAAQDTRERVGKLVHRSRVARQHAVRARERDRAALQRLEAREERIRRQILALTQDDPGPTYSGSTDGLIQSPVAGPVTSPFGWRTHPIYGYWGLHDGTDFGAGCGAPLWAGDGGTVINTYYDEVYGNRLYLSIGTVNGANVTLVYNHLTRYAVGEGARVSRGQVVGYVGSTGWSTGCHLHFTVLRNGTPVDPMNYL